MVLLTFSRMHGILSIPLRYKSCHTHATKIIRDHFVAPIPESERKDMMAAYYTQLNSTDETVRLRAAKAWSTWELVTTILYALILPAD